MDEAFLDELEKISLANPLPLIAGGVRKILSRVRGVPGRGAPGVAQVATGGGRVPGLVNYNSPVAPAPRLGSPNVRVNTNAPAAPAAASVAKAPAAGNPVQAIASQPPANAPKPQGPTHKQEVVHGGDGTVKKTDTVKPPAEKPGTPVSAAPGGQPAAQQPAPQVIPGTGEPANMPAYSADSPQFQARRAEVMAENRATPEQINAARQRIQQRSAPAPGPSTASNVANSISSGVGSIAKGTSNVIGAGLLGTGLALGGTGYGVAQGLGSVANAQQPAYRMM